MPAGREKLVGTVKIKGDCARESEKINGTVKIKGNCAHESEKMD